MIKTEAQLTGERRPGIVEKALPWSRVIRLIARFDACDIATVAPQGSRRSEGAHAPAAAGKKPQALGTLTAVEGRAAPWPQRPAAMQYWCVCVVID
jgi:hypothetical protein